MILPYRSPIKLEVSREGPAATARGGLVLLFEVLAAKRILVGLPRMGGSPAQGWSDAQMILAVLVLNVAGFDRVSDIEHLEADAGLCAMLGRFEAKLLGLSRRSIARRFTDDAWQPVAAPVETGIDAAGPDRPQLECADLPFVSNGSYSARPEHVIRYVVTRRALPGSLGLGEGELPAAHGRPAYAIRAYMTNFPAPDALPIEKANGLKTMHAREVVVAAHERCGHGEEVHAVLKSDLAAGMMPSGRFGANAAWLWLSALALNAMALVRRAAYGHEWRWVRMKRIRAVWIHHVARVVRHGRQTMLVLGAASAHLLAARQRMNLAMPPPAAPG